MTVARPRVGPPPLAVPPYQEVSPSHPGVRPGRRPSHGDGGRPRGAQPNASKPHPHVTASRCWHATPLGRRAVLSELPEAAGRRGNGVTAAIGFLLAC
jgi:hypothetical protein